MLPLIPLVSLAAGLVPDIIGLFGGKRAGEVAGKVAEVVRDVTKTDDPAAAARMIETDPALANQLRVDLERIKQRYVELQVQDAEAERQAMLATLRTEVEDRSSARNTMLGALGSEGWAGRVVALSPAILSVIVVVGFFLFTTWMVQDLPAIPDPTTGRPFVPDRSQSSLALRNVVIGALVAGFTAVLNYWLGSSQGSREKDRTVAQLQQVQAEQARDTVVQVRETNKETIAAIKEAPAAAPAATPAGSVAPVQRTGPIPGVPSRFESCLEIVLGKEGLFSNHEKDPGGATMMGITQRTLAAWRHRDVTVEEVAALTREEACEIYRANYWNTMRCDDLPKGVDLIVFDFGVNAGPVTSVKMLQRAAGSEPDGAVGDLTLRAVRSSDPRALIEALVTKRLEFYRSLDTFVTFGKGWVNRTEDVRKRALSMSN